MKPWVIERFIYPIYERINGLNIAGCQKKLEQSQYWSEEKLRNAQWTKFSKLLKYCTEHVPYYQNLFLANDIDLRQIQSFDDLQRIPILTKTALKDNLPLIFTDLGKPHLYTHKSSGSTGIPLVVYSDQLSESYRLAALFRSRKWWGWGVGHKTVELWGILDNFPNFRQALRMKFVENRSRFSSFNLSTENLNTIYKSIRAMKPHYIRGYVSSTLAMAQHMKNFNLSLSDVPLRAVCTTSEMLLDHQKQFIENTFHCPVINEYGSSEVGIISFACPKGGMHLMNDNLIIEFIKDNKTAKSDDIAELVITDLNNYTTPMIRYKIGDLGSYSDKSCTCGLNLKLMNCCIGRDTDLVYLKNGQQFLPMLFIFIGQKSAEVIGNQVRQFKVIQKAVDHFLVQVIADPQNQKTVADYFRSAFTERLGDFGKLDIEFVDEIAPEPSGKIRYFASEIKTDTLK
jgi:phenylacetate-CoA ligase